MWHEITITDLSQMGGNRVCIAGTDTRGNVFRPILPPPGIGDDRLYLSDSSVIRPRAVFRMNLEPCPRPAIPHIEDCDWLDPDATRFVGYLDDDSWRSFIQRTTNRSVIKIFDTKFENNNRNIRPGTGARSLGTIQPRTVFKFQFKKVHWDNEDRSDYRLSFYDATGEGYFNIKINDFTLQAYVNYHHRRGMSEAAISHKVEHALKRAQVWLRLGLTRPWQGRCWLQITGIYTFPDYLEGACFADLKY